MDLVIRRFLAQDRQRYIKETQYFDHYLKEVFPDELKCLKLRTEGKLGSKGKLNLGETELLFMLVGFSKEPCLLATSLHEPKYLVLIPKLLNYPIKQPDLDLINVKLKVQEYHRNGVVEFVRFQGFEQKDTGK